jgi:hypothetical protein
MKNAQISLHALPDEILSFVEKWLAKGGLFAAVVRIGPAFSVSQMFTADELRDDVARNGVPFRICLARTRFELHAATLHEFMAKNLIDCVVDIGAVSGEGLRESNISMSAEPGPGWKFWSSMAKEIKAATDAGLWAVSPVTGVRKFCKNNRYTIGAAKLAKEGRKLLPLAGWNFFEINGERAS